MTKDKFIQENDLVDGCIMLEPWNTFSKAIIKVIDKKHIVYDYDKLVEALAEDYKGGSENEENCYQNALDWVEYNTMRSIPYMSKGFRPYISQNGRIILK